MKEYKTGKSLIYIDGVSAPQKWSKSGKLHQNSHFIISQMQVDTPPPPPQSEFPIVAIVMAELTLHKSRVKGGLEGAVKPQPK